MSVSTPTAFQLKGSLFTLTVLQLLNTDIKLFAQQLHEVISKAPQFFLYAPVVIDLQALPDQKCEIDLAGICHLLRDAMLIPVGVRGGSTQQHEQATTVGLAVLSMARSETPTSKTKTVAKEATATPTTSKLITQPVRSGQQIYAKDADLIILGSVSPGAEILADGHIHVYGPLRGRALAGINDNIEARIFCHSMQAELISIAGRYILNETWTSSDAKTPIQIFLQEGKIEIQSL